MRRSVAALLLAGVVLAAPASAGAATVSAPGSTLQISAPAGQVNLVTIARSGTNYLVTDTGTPPVAILPCAPAGPAISCPAAGVTTIDVSSGDLNDSATLSPTVVGGFKYLPLDMSGEAGTDTLNGGENARASLSGGDDGDFLNSNAESDTLLGGLWQRRDDGWRRRGPVHRGPR